MAEQWDDIMEGIFGTIGNGYQTTREILQNRVSKQISALHHETDIPRPASAKDMHQENIIENTGGNVFVNNTSYTLHRRPTPDGVSVQYEKDLPTAKLVAVSHVDQRYTRLMVATKRIILSNGTEIVADGAGWNSITARRKNGESKIPGIFRTVFYEGEVRRARNIAKRTPNAKTT